tara:strand:- start:1020 stop:2288 length:1269 start_codon:yes stop_codon:yes gene_type:complete
MTTAYTNDLRLSEMATGENAGTWGTTTNTNLELVAEAFGYGVENMASNANTTITMADGVADAVRSIYLKITSTTLDATRTVTLAPNTISKIWIIENATTGSQSITIKQGSGAEITIPNGANKIVVTDGAGAGAAVFDALADIDIDSGTIDGVVIGGSTPAAGNFTAIDATGDITGATFTPDGDTSAGDAAAVGYTAAEGLILTGQGSTSDITLKNDADGTVFTVPTGTDDILFPDAARILMGAGSDLEIKHTGLHSYVMDSGTGNLYLAGDQLYITNAATSETKISALTDGAVTLYNDNAAKLATTATGVSVTGTLLATTNTDTSNTGSVTLDFGANQNFVLTLTGSVTLANPSTEQVGQAGVFVFIQDGTGGRTLSLGTDYESPAGGGITLSTAANAVDVVPYFVKASGSIQLGAPQLAFS